ncbi:hypothetical protein [Methylobacterium sp. 37f]|uniref:hypothetical protein n=1 Tax=Methylobacterium sp. 37f TaxID=2817058 RepID=UPI001FFCF463|nr:hypothetical protein [Methylobacterium sp. 37f]MCK2052809.1 hypothetical protein [Methylobacterium sp. 37f]
MTVAFIEAFTTLAGELTAHVGASPSENATTWRVTDTRCADADMLARLASVSRLATEGGFGALKVYGKVYGQLDPAQTPFDDLANDVLQVVLTKDRSAEWCYFLTEKGFGDSLNDALVAAPVAIWVGVPFEAFASFTVAVSPWGGTRTPPANAEAPERPLKLVRDLTQRRTPSEIGPWLLRDAPLGASGVFATWLAAAVERLPYTLPNEIRTVEGAEMVVLKGPRSAPIPIGPHGDPEWPAKIFEPLIEAATWVYASKREAEARFQFLNNHLSMDWRGGMHWPAGLLPALTASLTSAKEAYAFHIQDQSKEALKTLGDLRKSLQDEVGRAQSATRDLLSSLWRDLALAGVVLALKSPTAPQIATAGVLRWVTLATAVLLLVSLGITMLSNWRFNGLADQARKEWRVKLYAFVSKAEWARLVERPIAKGRSVYRIALPVVAAMYVAAAGYLFAVAEPDLAATLIERLGSLSG